METGLDLLALSSTAANSSARQKTPHQLGEKTKFVRQHLLPRLSGEHSAKLRSILERIDQLSVQRHDVIHGAGIGEEMNGKAMVMTFASLLQPKGRPRRLPMTVTADHLDKLTADIFDLWGDLLDFAEIAAREIRKN
ncbi:hypothetical protein [Bradyrhizobium sp. LTSP885]|uniref:hypothetical protein n=1 Tax=Bradyrhizobium sp. LTSP885 TaxID=1619232 RepID=UPI0012E0489E|nr:hypothetical protein [Bradyrhizobium sp. LTSP885]